MDRLRRLIAERATWWMWQTVASQAVRCPAPIKAREPVKEFHTRRSPTLPCELPVAAGDRAVEHGLVRRFRGVGAARGPHPAKGIRLVAESSDQSKRYRFNHRRTRKYM